MTDKYFIRNFKKNSTVVISVAATKNNEYITLINTIDLQNLSINRSCGILHDDKIITIRDVNFSTDYKQLFLIENAYNPIFDNYTDYEERHDYSCKSLLYK